MSGPESPTLAASAHGEAVRTREPQITQGSTVGRYVVLERVGAGGMGVVYSAYDPELNRRIALKVLRLDTEATEASRGRLLAEAQALARLSHPNVVAVYDVGTVDNEVWLAMEFVDGVTLTAWARDHPRDWKRTLAVTMDAGQGLAAAHAEGLVHRDVKPDNIMVESAPPGALGRARMMDFGLAVADPNDPSRVIGDPDAPVVREATIGHGIVGTPAYMAPEQFEGGAVDARTDQFGFCATLWESIYGTRPFSGTTIPELGLQVLEGRLQRPTGRVAAPGWLLPILSKGLATDPEDRFGSMSALLAALRRGRSSAMRRRVGLVAASAVGVPAAMWGVSAMRERAALAACSTSATDRHGAWNRDSRERVQTALAGVDAAHADETAQRVVAASDAWSDKWTSAWAAACRDGVDGSWPADRVEHAHDCLDESLWTFGALLAALAEPDASVLRRAVVAASTLPDPNRCVDPKVLALRPALPTGDERTSVDAARRELATASASLAAGTTQVDRAQALVDRVEGLPWSPMRGRALFALGKAQHAAGDPRGAEATLTDAYFAAVEAGDTVTVFDSANMLAFVVGVTLADAKTGAVWGRHAGAALRSLPSDSAHSVGLAHHLAVLHHGAGEFEQAKEQASLAVARAERIFGPEHAATATYLDTLGSMHFALAEYDAAHAAHDRALSIRQSVLGQNHPEVGSVLNNLANVHWARGELDDATSLMDRALSIRLAAFGPNHPEVGLSMHNLGNLYTARQRYDEAATSYERAIEIWEATLGADHPHRAASLRELGTVRTYQGRLDEALAIQQDVLDLQTRTLGLQHVDTATTLTNVARLQGIRGDHVAALLGYRDAIATLEAALGREHPMVGQALALQGRSLLATSRSDEAIAVLRRAVALLAQDGGDASTRADASLDLARALVDKDRPAALALAREAARVYDSVDPPLADKLAEADAWLASAAAEAATSE